MPLLEISDLAKSYGPAVVVKDFNLKVEEGEFVSIIGHSGCGKSTVLSIVMGLNDLSRGGVILGGREIDGPGLDRGVVFQSAHLLPWMTVEDNVALSVGQARPELSRAERRAEARKVLASVGLPTEGPLHPDALSSGMRQRVGIARAFALDPKVLLLDEPFSLLDALTRMDLQDELVRLWEAKHKTVLMVTHDVDEALLLSDRIVMMTQGPAATIGRIMSVPFPHPRRREEVFARADYFSLREELIDFLEDHEAPAPAAEIPPELVPSPYVPTGRIQMVPVLTEGL